MDLVKFYIHPRRVLLQPPLRGRHWRFAESSRGFFSCLCEGSKSIMASISAPPSIFTRQESRIDSSLFRLLSAETIHIGVASHLQSTSIWRQLTATGMHPMWQVARIQKWGPHISWIRQLSSLLPLPSLPYTPNRRPMTSRLSPLQMSIGLPISYELIVGSAEPGTGRRSSFSQAFPLYPAFMPAQRLTGLLHLGSLRSTRGEAARSRSFQECAALAEKQEQLNEWVGGSEEEQHGANPPFMVRAPGQRVVAIGDLHGDWDKSLAALRLAGVIEEEGPIEWAGGSTILVQVGDILDRGSDELAIMSLLRHLHFQAGREGGGVYQLQGNHETMNVGGEFRYVTEGGFLEASDFVKYCTDEKGGDWEEAFLTWWSASRGRRKGQRVGVGEGEGEGEGAASISRVLGHWGQMMNRERARDLLFQPGGPLAVELSHHSVVLLVNETLFAHGGILPHHVEYGLERMNNELSSWMRADPTAGSGGEAASMPFVATRGYDSVVWSRLYSQEEWGSDRERGMACMALASVLDAVGASRLVVGHTPQMGGANSACGGRVWRIDVGMSSGVVGAPPQVLEIQGNEVRVVKANHSADVNAKSRL